MQQTNIFINETGRLRSGWRLTIFGITIFIAVVVMSFILGMILLLIYGPDQLEAVLKGEGGFAAQGFILLVCAVGVGFLCQKLFENLPPKALGWAFHPRWLMDWLKGSLLGALTLILAALLATAFGGFKFVLAGAQTFPAVGKTLIFSFVIFIFAAASEEALFRGYPLQTMTRANLIWVGILITSLCFAIIHLGNPNQNISKSVRILAFTNTTLAGVWLAVAYLRTRSLWLPLGLHWAWNWMMLSVLGIPVSGITSLAPNPLMSATDRGPAWLTGGAYGIEGGAACTIALLLSTLFIWRTKLFSATEEMEELSSHEETIRSAENRRRWPDYVPLEREQPPPPV